MDKEIVEGNKLIEIFMGNIVLNADPNQSCDKHDYLMADGTCSCRFKFDRIIHNGEEILSGDTKYHTSWDWLMPVVEKIESFWNPYSDNCLYDEHEGSDFQISTRTVDIQTAGYKNGKYIKFDWNGGWDYKTSFKLQTVWQACVQFINWYNQNKQS